MEPVVVVDLPDAPAELRGRALDGCNAALRSGRCVLLGKADDAQYVALIRWKTDQRGIVVTFRRQNMPVSQAEVRHLSFADGDDRATRWAAAGLVVASLVSAESSRPTESPALELAAPVPPQPTTAPVAALSVSTLGSAAFAPRARTLGGLELLITGHLGALPMFGAVAARYALAPGMADLRTVDVGLGAGLRVGGWSARWSGELRCDFVWEHLTALGPAASSAADAASLTRLGGRATASLVLAASSRWAAITGAELTLLEPDVRVVLDGKQAAFDPSLRYGFLFGVRFSP